jgi:dTDP-glucose 4,6-dehydratase
VIGVDNLLTGSINNLDSRMTFVQQDAKDDLTHIGPVDIVFHLASPASPKDFGPLCQEVLEAGSLATFETLRHAEQHNARYVLASTSEAYGDPLVHPQPETYRGNVSTTGPRAAYDEAKRFAEAVVSTARLRRSANTGIARIFNTYGPGMRADDGRVITNFISQIQHGESITVYGDGSQTRSFCYVTDLVEGLVSLGDSDHPGPINLGNDDEHSVLELAVMLADVLDKPASIVFADLPENDPLLRKPDLTLARAELGYSTQVSLRDGLELTAADLKARLGGS